MTEKHLIFDYAKLEYMKARYRLLPDDPPFEFDDWKNIWSWGKDSPNWKLLIASAKYPEEMAEQIETGSDGSADLREIYQSIVDPKGYLDDLTKLGTKPVPDLAVFIGNRTLRYNEPDECYQFRVDYDHAALTLDAAGPPPESYDIHQTPDKVVWVIDGYFYEVYEECFNLWAYTLGHWWNHSVTGPYTQEAWKVLDFTPPEYKPRNRYVSWVMDRLGKWIGDITIRPMEEYAAMTNYQEPMDWQSREGRVRLEKLDQWMNENDGMVWTLEITGWEEYLVYEVVFVSDELWEWVGREYHPDDYPIVTTRDAQLNRALKEFPEGHCYVMWSGPY